MNPSSPKEIEVAAAIIEKDGRFLITKRLERSHLGHCWEFPGGKRKPHESFEDCAVRECREEIDVVIKPLRKVREVHHTYPEVSVHLHFILCELISGTPRALECADWTWVKPEDLPRYEFPAADQEIIQSLVHNAF